MAFKYFFLFITFKTRPLFRLYKFDLTLIIIFILFQYSLEDYIQYFGQSNNVFLNIINDNNGKITTFEI